MNEAPNSRTDQPPGQLDQLVAAGLGQQDTAFWLEVTPKFVPNEEPSPEALDRDGLELRRFSAASDFLLERLPRKPVRGEMEQRAADLVLETTRDARNRFLRAHAGAIYGELTSGYSRFRRASELVYDAADRFPGLTPTRETIDRERELLQKDKDGAEVDQGIFFSHLLSLERPGLHLVHAMLRPTEDAFAYLPRFAETGITDLGPVRLERSGKAGVLTFQNNRHLNAEDDSTVLPMEIAVDLVLLDPGIEVGVLRGGIMEHPKYAGKRVFSAGINLTHLYQGKISFVDFYLSRDLGFVNKLYRGLSGEVFLPGEPERTIEKPWIAAVEAFAIGGGCQILLTMDRVIAEKEAYLNLPARKEGIIPGAANLRLPRFVGDRMARQGILYERAFPVDSQEGRLLCDEVVEPYEMDAAIDRTVVGLTSSGVVSAAANRRALRVDQEPLDTFRRYMATYALEQARCHLSPALIENLERYWNAASPRVA